jgi:hypothetical protein
MAEVLNVLDVEQLLGILFGRACHTLSRFVNSWHLLTLCISYMESLQQPRVGSINRRGKPCPLSF